MGDGSSLSVPTLLSQVLVAFTIEVDNEFEQRMPHVTTAHGVSAGAGAAPGTPLVWLTSLVMWSNFMRYVTDEGGVPASDVQRQARVSDGGMHVAVGGMTRWGYVNEQPDPSDV